MTLQQSGRFAHSEHFLRQAAETCGWHILDVQKINLRTEKITGSEELSTPWKSRLAEKIRPLHEPAYEKTKRD